MRSVHFIGVSSEDACCNGARLSWVQHEPAISVRSADNIIDINSTPGRVHRPSLFDMPDFVGVRGEDRAAIEIESLSLSDGGADDFDYKSGSAYDAPHPPRETGRRGTCVSPSSMGRERAGGPPLGH